MQDLCNTVFCVETSYFTMHCPVLSKSLFQSLFCLKCLKAPQKSKKGDFLLSRLAVGFPRSLSLLYCTCKCEERGEGSFMSDVCVLHVFLALIPAFVCELAVIYTNTIRIVILLLFFFFYRKLTFTELCKTVASLETPKCTHI